MQAGDLGLSVVAPVCGFATPGTSIVKPSSLFELSVQATRPEVLVVDVTRILLGAAGTDGAGGLFCAQADVWAVTSLLQSTKRSLGRSDLERVRGAAGQAGDLVLGHVGTGLWIRFSGHVDFKPSSLLELSVQVTRAAVWVVDVTRRALGALFPVLPLLPQRRPMSGP